VSLILAAFAFLLPGKKGGENDERKSLFGPIFFLITAGIFFVIAHGYYLIFTPTTHTLFSHKITLPLFWLSKAWPSVTNFAMPYRAAVVVTLCVSILMAMGLSHLINKVKHKTGRALIILAGIGLLAEAVFISPVPFPLPQEKITVPEVYRDLAEIEDCGGVLEVPFETLVEADSPSGMNLPYLFYQQFHGHPLANYDKYLFGHPVAKTEFMSRLMKAVYGLTHDVVDEPAPEGNPAPHFKYLVLHEGLIDQKQKDETYRFLSSTMEFRQGYHKDDISLWVSKRPEEKKRPEGSAMECLLIDPVTFRKEFLPVIPPTKTNDFQGMNPMEEK
jgi:hypothetical protein